MSKLDMRQIYECQRLADERETWDPKLSGWSVLLYALVVAVVVCIVKLSWVN